jgi:hypothetical protein
MATMTRMTAVHGIVRCGLALAAAGVALLLGASTAAAAPAPQSLSGDCGNTRVIISGGTPDPFILPAQAGQKAEVDKGATLTVRVENPRPNMSVRWAIEGGFGLRFTRHDPVPASGIVPPILLSDYSDIVRGAFTLEGELLVNGLPICSTNFDVNVGPFGGVVAIASTAGTAVGALGAVGAAAYAASGAGQNWKIKLKLEVQRRRRRGWRRWVPMPAWKRTIFATFMGAVTGLFVSAVMQQAGVTPFSIATAVRNTITGGAISFGVSIGLGAIVTFLKKPVDGPDGGAAPPGITSGPAQN